MPQGLKAITSSFCIVAVLQMNGGFPPGPPPPPPPHPYYDPYFYDYYPSDPYYNNYMRSVNGNSSHKRYPSGDKDTKSGTNKADKDRDAKNHDTEPKKAETLEEDFPSLNGDTEHSDSKPVTKPVTSASVWGELYHQNIH